MKRIGHLYPKAKVTAEMAADRPDLKPYVGSELTVIAWLWARTVKSPNPAFRDVDVPLASTFMVSTKEGKEAWIEQITTETSYRLKIRIGRSHDPEKVALGTSAGKRKGFLCLMSESAIPYDYIRSEAKAGRMGIRLLATVVDSPSGRLYLSPDKVQEEIAALAQADWVPNIELPKKHRNFQGPVYGLDNIGDIFTQRQLVMLNALSDLTAEARQKVISDCFDVCQNHVSDYADAVQTYLSETVSKLSAYHCAAGVWRPNMSKSGRLFGRQAIPMVWDFPECNPFAGAGGDFLGAIYDSAKTLLTLPDNIQGVAVQRAAQVNSAGRPNNVVISTDPPYYDNVAYAELSDFYYAWLRKGLRETYPELLSTMAVPKADELVAATHRQGSKEAAEKFFLEGMTEAMRLLVHEAHPSAPVTIYYAFKQSEKRAVRIQLEQAGRRFLARSSTRGSLSVALGP